MTADEETLRRLLQQDAEGLLKPKDRFDIPSQEMPAQDEVARRGNSNEVATGYTEVQARLEAMRCLQCKAEPCLQGCPVKIRIRTSSAPSRRERRMAWDLEPTRGPP